MNYVVPSNDVFRIKKDNMPRMTKEAKTNYLTMKNNYFSKKIDPQTGQKIIVVNLNE